MMSSKKHRVLQSKMLAAIAITVEVFYALILPLADGMIMSLSV